ncbi:Global nitrogen regulator [Acaryochloris thomasi RCC1774]|uniref:Global nitrogen regulator n=1 Tax=Acaryochloris thomasi RCC1774 TaxID=1764569 RepID=A0A2W1JQ81_9CYAN|nr:Crp/Fnr family transcriptional regulator [Acaryochloris thomasi]PZD73052.1 Global nitrogen regulator [Acaryochloris thomasi RCC1774]
MVHTQTSTPPTTAQLSPTTDFRQLLEEIYQGRHLHDFKRNQRIQLQPHEVWVVCKGIVQLSTLHPTGDESIVGLACASMPFGLPFTRINPYEAHALSNVVLMRLHQMEIEQSPRLAQGLFQQLGHRLKQTEAVLAMASQRRVEDRLKQLLLLLSQDMGQVTSEGIRITVRLTHQQIANLTATTRVTITRLLQHLRQERWLEIDSSRHFIVLNPIAS